ncbi:MAG: hypothetical protein M3Z26_06840 [Bacteroidota bacterium]|nr:hypothetical protein [Bacteroidota bacterium]
MFYSAKNNDTSVNMSIGVAFSKNAEGPFIDKGVPLLQGKGFSNIDPMAMVDRVLKQKMKYVRRVMCIEPVGYKDGWPVVEKKD